MLKFFRKDDGLVTIEWVGIAAVMVLAAIAITAYIVESADGAGGKVKTGLNGILQPTIDGNNGGGTGTTP